jgi:hypothetical protein
MPHCVNGAQLGSNLHTCIQNDKINLGLLILFQKCKSEKIVHLGKWDSDDLMNILLTTLNKDFSLNSIEMSNPLVEDRYFS